MGDDYKGYNDNIVYYNEVPIGNLISLQANTIDLDLDSEDITTIIDNKEFSFTFKNPNWFPDELGKIYYMKNNVKSKRLKKKYNKIYNQRFNELFKKYFGG